MNIEEDSTAKMAHVKISKMSAVFSFGIITLNCGFFRPQAFSKFGRIVSCQNDKFVLGNSR